MRLLTAVQAGLDIIWVFMGMGLNEKSSAFLSIVTVSVFFDILL